MEAHARLKKKGFNVHSYGTGDKIKLPGPSASQNQDIGFNIHVGQGSRFERTVAF